MIKGDALPGCCRPVGSTSSYSEHRMDLIIDVQLASSVPPMPNRATPEHQQN